MVNIWFPHLGSLGKKIKLALVNNLMHYIPSTLLVKYGKRKIHGPTPSSPTRKNYEITLRTLRYPGVANRPWNSREG
ncbi:hypothetical protein GOBAR_DD06535 [Gossypium barbadense]|nr:hypothetical protein GOBAR_DD06535 [Gossypium barbadense]